MDAGIRVRVIPGCPTRVVADSQEDRELVKAALSDVDCGVAVESAEPESFEEAPESVEPVEELAEPVDIREVAGEPSQEPVCPLEPEVPWKDSVCGELEDKLVDRVIARILEREAERGVPGG